MECIQHFSHEHPLSFIEVDDVEEAKPCKCCICGLPILSSPSYTCSIDVNCTFFVHKVCAQLPRELYYAGHRDTLYLERPTLSPRDSYKYKCRNCEFDLHPLVAKAVEIKSKHISHTSHPLVAVCREIVCDCDGCGEEQKGFFFHCQECNFWIHQDCTILPTIVKLANIAHPYILSYSPPFNLLEERCADCRGPWRLCYNGVYLNGETYDLVHVKCAKSKMENLPTETMGELIVDLPEDRFTFPSLVIRRFAEGNPSTLKHHQHPLVLAHSNSNGDLEEVCDVCIQPIDHIFYRCQSDGCHFVAHDICANHLPTSTPLFFSGQHLEVVPIQQDSEEICFNSVFPCYICFRPSNGFVFGLLDEGEFWGFCDVECASTPKIIRHASHRKHLLFEMAEISERPLNCCSGESYACDFYRCIICDDFSIHIRCALLPKYTRHKFDDHLLQLITTHTHDGKPQELFCEVCEQQIQLKWWYYGCHKCHQFFHINCIPSVGCLSKVKFGKTYVDYKLHHHPLSLTRMLTHQRHETCGVCNQIIKGFSDDQMAFHCSHCHFWIHFSCAAATTEFIDYSKYLKFLQHGLLGETNDDVP